MLDSKTGYHIKTTRSTPKANMSSQYFVIEYINIIFFHKSTFDLTLRLDYVQASDV